MDVRIRHAIIFSIFLIGLMLRLWLVSTQYGNADQTSYDIVRGILDSGGNVYAETRFYNYSPLWMGVLRSADLLSDSTGMPYPAVIRTILTVGDITLALLLARLAGSDRHWHWEVFALYWLNPGAIAIIGYGGQFEILTLIPLVGAALALNRGKPLRWVFTFGVAAVLMKHSTVFLVWALFVYAVIGAMTALVSLPNLGVDHMLIASISGQPPRLPLCGDRSVCCGDAKQRAA